MRKLIFIIVTLLSVSATAQMEGWVQTFKDTRIINGHSVENNFKGGMKFIISHRFGSINGGPYEFFGIDQSTIRIGLDYGITDRLTIGLGRSSYLKTLDAFAKYRIFVQKENGGSPVSVTAISTTALETVKWAEPDRQNYFTSRLFYAHQLLISRRFNEDLAIQIMPSVVHRNIVPDPSVKHDVISIGAAGRYQLTKKMALQAEAYYVLENQLSEGYHMPISIGIDIETKGHQFQFSLSNALGMTEKFFITETTNDWLDGGIGLGFNITRDFRIRGRK
ncbi:MAG: hypothetical protein GC193_04620 [Cryomorphaceae bacterium]|nr:hypothetical protein [Cryomorphaceae bacterium]